eukprot:TRINITY_DN5759_c0_g2_i2.p1 TRINITY_DN5759_c0_g2~~TRINITY_DN5759_c0_g2_i2.p1  ORF type:complete len:264 (-),score=44.70 TRINITY_DN5759_c0_g2_i2:255-983(-)
MVLYEALSGLRPLLRKTKDATLRANAKASISYELECFERCCSDVTGLLRMMLRAASLLRCTSLVALDVSSKILTSHEATEVQVVQDADMALAASTVPPEQVIAQSIADGKTQPRLRLQELQRMRNTPRLKNRLSLQTEEPQASSAPVGMSDVQSSEVQASVKTTEIDEAGRNTNMSMAGTQRSMPFERKYSPSAPQADPPVRDFLREYRRKTMLKNRSALPTPEGSCSSTRASTSASISSPS